MGWSNNAGGWRSEGWSGPAAAGGAYVGPGDVVSSAFAWWGLRGYNAAYATGSNPALDIVDQAGANQLTINILANGRLDVASISAWVTANSVSTIKVKKAYDQTGNARHMTQATLANMPVLNLTGFGSLPAIQVTAASSHSMTTGVLTLAQPQTWSAVFLRNSSGATTRELLAFGGSLLLFSVQNNIQLSAGTSTASIAATDAAWHAAQAVYNTTSSAAYVDGSSTTGLSVGTNNASGLAIQIGGVAVSNYFDGRYAEWGVWGSAFNGTQAGDMNTNQHGTNGHNF
jgi:hypothetical protein